MPVLLTISVTIFIHNLKPFRRKQPLVHGVHSLAIFSDECGVFLGHFKDSREQTQDV